MFGVTRRLFLVLSGMSTNNINTNNRLPIEQNPLL